VNIFSFKAIKVSAIYTAVAVLLPASVQAGLLDFQGQYQTELEENAAISNQATYDQLKAAGCQDNGRVPTAACSGITFVVWSNVRELVHTANELSNVGPTTFSLDSDLDGLGFALRWTSGEEFSSEESMADSFVSGQLSSLASRLTALRSGARGFNIAGLATDENGDMVTLQNKPSSGMNAGDETGDAWSKLGGFINGSYTYGDQRASERENAFDFDGTEFNVGVDYRIDNHWVVGAIFGYITEEIDFDSEASIVDGTVEMDGLSLMSFVLYQSDEWYWNASAGYQAAEFTTERSIRYPSFNPNIDSADTVAESENDAYTLSATMSGGYTFRLADRFTIEPSLSVNYQDITIEEYSEQDINNDGFNFIVSEQAIKSLETVVALKVQYTFSTQFGVFMPFIDLQSYGQHEGDERYIDAVYASVSDQITGDAAFSLPTNSVDSDYKIYGIGLAAVIRGSRQAAFGSAASGGVQAHVNFRELKDIGGYNQKIISGGVRYEF